MHVLLIHQSYAALDEPGGTRHAELAQHLVNRGHQVTVIASPVSYLTGARSADGEDDHQQASGQDAVTVLRAYTYPGLHRSFAHRVFSFLSFMIASLVAGLKVRDVDLVWGTSPPIFQGATAWLIARVKRVPFLFEVRDLWPAFAVAVGVLRQPLLIRASEWLERFLYRQADVVVVNSPGFIRHVRSRGARRVELVPNGVEVAMFDPAADGLDFRRRHQLEGKFVALYAGAHGLSNDLEVVLHSAESLRDLKEMAIVLLGDGKEKPALQAKARQLNLTNIVFLPPVPKKEMPEALAAADACIGILKPVALYATVYPNKIFDYMAAGRPVVLAMEGVIREVVEAAGAGIYVPPGDAGALAAALRRLAEDPAAGREMGMHGRRCVETSFNRPEIALQMEAVMQSVARQNKV